MVLTQHLGPGDSTSAEILVPGRLRLTSRGSLSLTTRDSAETYRGNLGLGQVGRKIGALHALYLSQRLQGIFTRGAATTTGRFAITLACGQEIGIIQDMRGPGCWGASAAFGQGWRLREPSQSRNTSMSNPSG